MARDTAHIAQHAERAHWCTAGKWPKTPQTQENAPCVHSRNQEPSG